MSGKKRTSLIVFAAVAAIGVAIAVNIMAGGTSEEPQISFTPNEEMVELANELVHIDVQPEFPFSYDYMTEGVLQHLDREYTYDIIPYQLKGGLIFQGIHRPPKGTSLRIELLKPATIYFFFHSKTNGGYNKIFEQLPEWKLSKDAPQYDIHNGNHGLRMTMYRLVAQPGIIEIPATTKDKACFNMVFQTDFGKLAEPNS
jgi:hypothetical protein